MNLLSSDKELKNGSVCAIWVNRSLRKQEKASHFSKKCSSVSTCERQKGQNLSDFSGPTFLNHKFMIRQPKFCNCGTYF